MPWHNPNAKSLPSLFELHNLLNPTTFILIFHPKVKWYPRIMAQFFILGAKQLYKLMYRPGGYKNGIF
jgi:hypothetical protein